MMPCVGPFQPSMPSGHHTGGWQRQSIFFTLQPQELHRDSAMVRTVYKSRTKALGLALTAGSVYAARVAEPYTLSNFIVYEQQTGWPSHQATSLPLRSCSQTVAFQSLPLSNFQAAWAD